MNQDFLREKIYEYCNKYGIKKSQIAKEINENPNNFSRWLTKKRNYGNIREKQIIDWLLERGVLNEKDII